MKICSVAGCDVKNYGLSFCKRHYRSFKRYGNAETVDSIQKFNEENNIKPHRRIKQNRSTEGTCEVEGCEKSIKAKRLCNMHLKRLERTGNTDDKESAKYKHLEYCIVENCYKVHKSLGYCETHIKIFREFGTPYRPKIIRLCGVDGCEKPLQAKGLCMNHYSIWKKTIAFITEN